MYGNMKYISDLYKFSVQTGQWKDVVEIRNCGFRYICLMVFSTFEVGIGVMVIYTSFIYDGPVEGRLY